MSKNENKIDKNFVKQVIKEIDYIKGDEFAKRLIMETPSGRYWTKDGFTSSDYLATLDHNGIRSEDAITVHSDSSWGTTYFNKWFFEPNGEYIVVLEFLVGNRPSGNYYIDRLNVNFQRIIRLNKNATFNVVSPVASPYSSVDDYDGRIEEFLSTRTEDLTCVSIDRRKIFSYRRNASDIETKVITSMSGGGQYEKYITTETWNKVTEWLMESGVSEGVIKENYFTFCDKIQTNSVWSCFREMKKRITSQSKTKDELLSDVFTPIVEAINKWVVEKTAVKATPLIDFMRGFMNNKENAEYRYNYERCQRPHYNSFIVRNNEWLIYSDGLNSNSIIFYNIEQDKKYHITTCRPWDSDVKNIEIKSIGVFNINRTDLTSQDIPCCYCFMANETYHGYYDDVEWCDTCKMYDILGNELTFDECFDDVKMLASSYEYIKNETWFPSYKKLGEEDNISNYIKGQKTVKDYKMDDHTIEALSNQHRVPRLFMSIILLKNKYRTAAEQLLKSKLFGFLQILGTDQNAFMPDVSSVYSYWRMAVKFDTSKTNLKDCFATSLPVLRAIDEIIQNTQPEDRAEVVRSIALPAMILGEDRARALNVDMYKKLVSFCVDHRIHSHTIEQINPDAREVLSKYYDSPNILLKVFEKIGDIGIWCDYIRMRQQLKTIVANANLSFNFKEYKDIPDKSIKFVTLRPKLNEYAWGEENRWKDEWQQYKELEGVYRNITQIFQDNDQSRSKPIAVILEMDTADHIRYLHDELSFWISYYRNKEKDVLFGTAVQRVKKYEWSDDQITIIAPKVANDVQYDAGVLSHCAASFIDPIINGTENIMFIRRKDMPDIPWFTMAIDNHGNIEQIHLYRNGNLSMEDQAKAYINSSIPSYSKPVDVMKSLKKWAKEKGINQSTLSMKYGALCARR